MHFEFLVEEFSAEECLKLILPKILPQEITYEIHDFRGKSNLIKKLPQQLAGYKSWIPKEYKIIVIVDKDDDDCDQLKDKLEQIAIAVGFITKSTAKNGQCFQVLNRIAIEELEAWYFGDVKAIISAYPKVNPNLSNIALRSYVWAVFEGSINTIPKILKLIKSLLHPIFQDEPPSLNLI